MSTPIVIPLLMGAGLAGCAHPDVTTQDVADALVGRHIEAGDIAWRFEPDEPRQITVIAQEKQGREATVLAYVKTHDEAHRNDCMGEIRLRFEWAGRWVIRSMLAGGSSSFTCKRPSPWL